MIQISQLIREGSPATNPYGPTSKRHVFWQRGADEARTRADAVLQIGA